MMHSIEDFTSISVAYVGSPVQLEVKGDIAEDSVKIISGVMTGFSSTTILDPNGTKVIGFAVYFQGMEAFKITVSEDPEYVHPDNIRFLTAS